MRYAVKYTLAATLVAGAAAHQHGHQQFHARKEASPVEQRDEPDVVTKYVAGPTATVYELDGEALEATEAQDGIDAGNFIVVGETVPTFVPPPPPPPPEPTTSEAPELGAQFIEKPSAPPPKPPPPPPKPKVEKPDVSVNNAGGSGDVNTPFPSGKVKCSEFPSKYGALSLDWLNFGGWSGLQFVPDFTEGALSIKSIITGIDGDTCSEGCMCSYACPAGYQKTQWPKAQGSTKESIGGLYCNNEGYLELTRPEFDTLCDAGVGGVSIQNDLDDVVSTCRTDYPGTENMVIPAIASPGDSVDLCNPDQENYYVWDGMSTSAQYYVNPKGFGKEDACVWKSGMGPEKAGNWAPVVAGVGRASDGITYLSIFQNRPTSNAKLDFNIEITGDVTTTTKCSYINGKWSGGGSDGCTTGMKPGGKAVFRYF